MEQKLYARVGKSFKPIPNYVSMYWDGENWTKERTKKSIAKCYDQKGTIVFLVNLHKHIGINWYTAMKKASKTGGYLPSHVQASLAVERCEELREDNDWYWTRDEYSSISAWYWNWNSFPSFAYFSILNKSGSSKYRCARIFFDFNIKL